MGRAMRPSLAPRLSNALALAPALRDGMRLLRLNQQDLAEDIREEVANNPFLVCDWPAPRLDPVHAAQMDALPTPTPSFFQDLCRQIDLAALSPLVRPLALHLVGELREDGMLDADVLDRMLDAGAASADLDAALAALQACDPPGVGARSLTECLELQLRDLGLPPEAARRTVAAMPLLAANDLQGAAQVLDLTHQQTRERLDLVRRLRAAPRLPESRSVAVVQVDAVVTLTTGRAMQIEVGAIAGPRLVLDQAMVARARATGFGADLLARAEALLSAMTFRHDTLRNVVQAIVEHQHRALTDGAEWLRPLTQRELAHGLGLHPSTVCRAVADKAIEAQGRVWRLSALFSGALPRQDGGGLAAASVRMRIARMIAGEGAQHPLTDTAITERLRLEGVDIARRTVARYREMMRIPGSAARRAKAAGAAARTPQRQAHSNRGPRDGDCR